MNKSGDNSGELPGVERCVVDDDEEEDEEEVICLRFLSFVNSGMMFECPRKLLVPTRSSFLEGRRHYVTVSWKSVNLPPNPSGFSNGGLQLYINGHMQSWNAIYLFIKGPLRTLMQHCRLFLF